MKKRITFIMSIVCLALCFSVIASAKTDFDGYTPISDADGLLSLMNDSAMWGGKYYLTDNIVLPAGSAQTPIGTTSAPFTGIFDGDGKEISGLAIDGNFNLGLFGVIDGATIQNLTVKGNVTCKATASGQGNNIGGIVGFAYMNNVVKNCVSYIDVTLTSTVSNTGCGGVVGKVGGATVGTFTMENCVNYGTVTGKQATGGVLGLDQHSGKNSAVTVKGCENYGTVNGTVGSGGVVGIVQHSGAGSTVVISECKNYGTVNGSSSCSAGILAYLYVGVTSEFTLEKSANYGDINGAGYAAGVLGAHIANGKQDAYAIDSVLSELYNEGDIVGTAATSGGVVGSYQTSSASGSMVISDILQCGTLPTIGQVQGATPLTLTRLYNEVGTSNVGKAPATNGSSQATALNLRLFT